MLLTPTPTPGRESQQTGPCTSMHPLQNNGRAGSWEAGRTCSHHLILGAEMGPNGRATSPHRCRFKEKTTSSTPESPCQPTPHTARCYCPRRPAINSVNRLSEGKLAMTGVSQAPAYASAQDVCPTSSDSLRLVGSYSLIMSPRVTCFLTCFMFLTRTHINGQNPGLRNFQ